MVKVGSVANVKQHDSMVLILQRQNYAKSELHYFPFQGAHYGHDMKKMEQPVNE